jgi:hypothetical protein
MLRKVKIKKLPQARTGYQVKGALANDVPAFGGADYNAYIGKKSPEVRRNLTAVNRDEANLEAEGGETVVGNIDGSGMPSTYMIKGPRHHSGGVPLNLPDDSFIFSDTQSMKITDPVILKMFNKSDKKGGYTPAELSKPYDINKYRKILQDPDSDKVARKTAEMMIKNYVMKLGALALAQEGKKGFPQGIPVIAQPYMQANKITEEDVMPELAKAKQQEEQMLQQQMMQQQALQEQPMEMQEQPMAAYGMQMGGYDFPYYPEQMAYGGMVKYQQAGEVKTKSRTKTKEELEKDVASGKVKPEKVKTLPDGTIEITTKDGKKVYAKGTVDEGAEDLSNVKPRKVTNLATDKEKYKKDICAKIKKSGKSLDYAVAAGWIASSQKANFAGCVDESKVNAQKETTELFELEEETPADETVQRCECPDGSDPGMNEDGTCKDCESEEMEMNYGTQTPERPEPEWWLQDKVNMMGAVGDRLGLRKYMPWEARIDLEEPRPTFLDPTRELAQQSEQANIASQALSSFAGPQALNARLAQIQGQGAKQAADTLSRYNNANVGTANQFEANQVGIRNQEQMLNQQMANRLFDKNVIANQQFDNARRQAAANMRQAFNTGVTNMMQTDAMNQMYPNYQVDPRTGGKVYYNPTDKTVDPGEEQKTMGQEFADLVAAGFDKDEASKAILKKYYKKKGGDVGYVYTNWPIFL